MSNFVGTSPFLNSIMGCHGNHAFSHSPDRFILRTLFCIKGGLNEQFGTQEKMPMGWKVTSLIGPDYIVLKFVSSLNVYHH